MRLIAITTLALAIAGPAFAADTDGDSYAGASKESGEAVAALAEAGVKTVTGVVAVPIALTGLTSQAAGSTALAAGDSAMTVGGGLVLGAEDAADFASAPLTVTDKVVTRAPPAPAVPYEAQTAIPPSRPK